MNLGHREDCSVPQKKTLDPIFSFAYKMWMQFYWFIVVPNEPKGSDEWNIVRQIFLYLFLFKKALPAFFPL